MQHATRYLLAGLLSSSVTVLAQAASPMTLEERMIALEARASAAEVRAAAAERQAQAIALELQQLKGGSPDLPASAQATTTTPILDARLAKVEARQEALEELGRSERQNPSKLTNGFNFNGYARSGLLVGEGLSGGRGGPYVTPAGSVGGAVGRLGNEDDFIVGFYQGIFI